MRGVDAIALDLLQCAVSWEPKARLLGNVPAYEIAALAARHVMTCPSCGAEAWVNIDCDMCRMCSLLVSGQAP